MTHDLPQLSNRLFLTDGGMETTLIFHEGIELPCFSTLPLLRESAGREALEALALVDRDASVRLPAVDDQNAKDPTSRALLERAPAATGRPCTGIGCHAPP